MPHAWGSHLYHGETKEAPRSNPVPSQFTGPGHLNAIKFIVEHAPAISVNTGESLLVFHWLLFQSMNVHRGVHRATPVKKTSHVLPHMAAARRSQQLFTGTLPATIWGLLSLCVKSRVQVGQQSAICGPPYNYRMDFSAIVHKCFAYNDLENSTRVKQKPLPS